MAPRKKVTRAKAPAPKSAKRNRAKSAKTKALSVRDAIVREELPSRSATAAPARSERLAAGDASLVAGELHRGPAGGVLGGFHAFGARSSAPHRKNASARAKQGSAHAQSTGRLPCRPQRARDRRQCGRRNATCRGRAADRGGAYGQHLRCGRARFDRSVTRDQVRPRCRSPAAPHRRGAAEGRVLDPILPLHQHYRQANDYRAAHRDHRDDVVRRLRRRRARSTRGHAAAPSRRIAACARQGARSGAAAGACRGRRSDGISYGAERPPNSLFVDFDPCSTRVHASNCEASVQLLPRAWRISVAR